VVSCEKNIMIGFNVALRIRPDPVAVADVGNYFAFVRRRASIQRRESNSRNYPDDELGAYKRGRR